MTKPTPSPVPPTVTMKELPDWALLVASLRRKYPMVTQAQLDALGEHEALPAQPNVRPMFVKLRTGIVEAVLRQIMIDDAAARGLPLPFKPAGDSGQEEMCWNEYDGWPAILAELRAKHPDVDDGVLECLGEVMIPGMGPNIRLAEDLLKLQLQQPKLRVVRPDDDR